MSPESPPEFHQPTAASRSDDLRPSSAEHPFALTLQLSIFASVGALLMLMAPELSWSIKLFMIALVLLSLKHWGGFLMLLLIQADLFLREGGQFAGLRGAWGIVFVFVVVSVLMFVARHRHLLSQLAGGSVLTLLKDIFKPPSRESDLASEPPESPLLVSMVSSALRGVTLLLCCTLTARFLLGLLPNSREFQGDLRELTDIDPTMSAGVTLVVSVVAAWLVVSEIAWRRLTPAQCRVLLRSVFLKIHYRDLRMIVLRRLKQRIQRAAAKKKAS